MGEACPSGTVRGQGLPPAFTDMCHLWGRQRESIWGILLSASQENHTEGASEGGSRQPAGQVWSSFRSEITHSVLGAKERCPGARGQGPAGKSAFPWVVLFALLGLNTCHPLENSASERSRGWNSAFSSALYCFFCLFVYFSSFPLFIFYLFHLLFLCGEEVREWSSQAGSMLSSSTQRR